MEDELIEIDKETKESLLNLSPSTDKGVIKDKKKPVKEEPNKTPPVAPAKEELDINEALSLDEDKFSFAKDPNRPERDSSLPNEEFKSKYLEERPNREYSNVRGDKVRNNNYDRIGEGVEDYRKYIDNPMHNVNLDYTRAVNQTNWAKAGNGAMRFLLNVVPETVQQGSNMVESVYNFATNNLLPVSDRTSYGNPVYDLTKDIKESVNNQFNIYLKNPEESMSVGDFGWWADRTSSLATSVSSFVALGYLTGGLAGGTRITNAIGRLGGNGRQLAGFLKAELAAGTKLSEVVKIASLNKAGLSYANMGDALFSSYLLTSSESMGVATEVYNNTKEKELQFLLKQGYTKKKAIQEANRRGMRAGDRAFMFNQWNIALNMTSTLPFLRGTGQVGKIAKRTLGGGAKKVGLEGVQESLEETVNLISEKRAVDEEYSFDKALEDVATAEGAESAFLGFIGGFAQTGLTLTGQYIKKDGKSNYDEYLEKYAAQEEARESFQNYSASNKINEWSILKSTSEQTEQVNKINKLKKDYNEATTEEERINLSAQINEEQTTNFISQAYNAFQFDQGGLFIEQLEAMKNLTDEEAKAQGFDVSEENNYRKNLDERIQDIIELEKIYNYSKSLYKGDDIYGYMSNVYYYKNLSKTYVGDIAKKEDAYLEEAQRNYEQIVDEPLYDLSIKEGIIRVDKKEEYAKRDEEFKERISKIEKEKVKKELKLAKDKERLSTAKKNTESINKQQIEVLEKEVEFTQGEIDDANTELADIEGELQLVQEKENINNNALNTLDNAMSATNRGLTTLVQNNLVVQQKAKENQEEADKLASVKGQQEAKEQYIASRKLIDKINSDLKAREKQRKAEEKKAAQEKAKKNPNEAEEIVTPVVTKEETEEVVTPIDTIPTITKDGVDSNVLSELLNYTEEELEDGGNEAIQGLYDILKHTNDSDIRQRLIIGMLYGQVVNIDTPSFAKVVDVYNSIEKFKGTFNKFTADQLIGVPKAKDFRKEFIAITKKPVIVEKLDNIENFSADEEGLKDMGDTDASKIIAQEFKEKDDEKEIRELSDWIEDAIESVGLTVQDTTKKIVVALTNEFGEHIIRPIFYKIQGYLMYKDGKRRARFYNTLIKTKQEIDKENKERERRVNSTKVEEFKESSLQQIEEDNKKTVAVEILESEGVLINLDTPFFDSPKLLSISDALAYKVKESKHKLEKGLIVTIGNGKLSDVDNRMLIEEGLKIGDKVNFRIAEISKDSEGNIYRTKEIKENGKTVGYNTIKTDKDGIESAVSSLEFAGIQVYIGDSPLRNVYLHLPSYINSEHIPYNRKEAEEFDRLLETETIENLELLGKTPPVITTAQLQAEKDSLNSLRQRVLDGEIVEAKIEKKGDGYFIESTVDTLSENMPNVLVAIFNGNNFTIGLDEEGQEKTIEIEQKNKEWVSGRTYVLIPKGTKNNREYTPYAVYKDRLGQEENGESITVVTEMIRLKLMDKSNISDTDAKLLKYYKDNGTDILDDSYEGYLNFVHTLKTIVPISQVTPRFDFKLEREKYEYPRFFIGYKHNKIVIYLGSKRAPVNFDSNKITSNETLTNSLKELKVTLPDVLFNVRRELLGKNKVFIPSINKGEEQYTSYDAYIKNRLRVNIKSIKVDGEDVYRVQKSIHFSTEKDNKDNEDTRKIGKALEKENNVLNKKQKEKITEMVEKDTIETIVEEETKKKLEALEDIDNEFEEDDIVDNLESFGIAKINDMPNTIEELKKDKEISGTEEDGKPCSI